MFIKIMPKNVTAIKTIDYAEVQLVGLCTMEIYPDYHQIFTIAKILHVSSKIKLYTANTNNEFS